MTDDKIDRVPRVRASWTWNDAADTPEPQIDLIGLTVGFTHAETEELFDRLRAVLRHLEANEPPPAAPPRVDAQRYGIITRGLANALGLTGPHDDIRQVRIRIHTRGPGDRPTIGVLADAVLDVLIKIGDDIDRQSVWKQTVQAIAATLGADDIEHPADVTVTPTSVDDGVELGDIALAILDELDYSPPF